MNKKKARCCNENFFTLTKNQEKKVILKEIFRFLLVPPMNHENYL